MKSECDCLEFKSYPYKDEDSNIGYEFLMWSYEHEHSGSIRPSDLVHSNRRIRNAAKDLLSGKAYKTDSYGRVVIFTDGFTDEDVRYRMHVLRCHY